MKRKITAKELINSFSIKRFIASIMVVVFFVAIIVVYNTLLYSSVRDDILKSGELSANTSAEQFDKYLSTGVDAIKLASYELDGMIRRNASSEEILEYVTRKTEVITQSLVKNTTGLYTYINGEFYDGSGWVPDEDYEPESRPWYKEAIQKKGNVAIVDPYLDMQTGSVLMTLAKTLGDGKSIIALDLTMDEIQEMIEQTTEDESVIARMLVCSNGTVVAHSDKSQCGHNYLEETDGIGHAIVSKLYKENSQNFEVQYDGHVFIVYAVSIGDDWYSLSVAKSELSYTPLRIMLITSAASIVITILVLSFILIRSAKRSHIAETLSSQLLSAADIYLSLVEIDLVKDTYSEIKKMYVIDDVDETGMTVQELFSRRMMQIPDSPTKQAAIEFVDFSTLNERLKDTNIITIEFLSFKDLWIRARFVVSGRDENGNVTKVMWMAESIDEEKRVRDELTEQTQKLTSQLSSSADIYMSLCDLDIINNEVTAIKNVNPAIQKLVDSCDHNMQELFFKIMMNQPESPTKQAAIDFSDMSTIDERMGSGNSLTLEYLSYGNIWVRARLVVSERTETGKISHVLWMLENINEEKKARDSLTHRADKLMMLLSSTADIYISVCDLDIINNTISEIKNEDPDISEFVNKCGDRMQKVMTEIMHRLPESSTKQAATEFVDFSDIDIRMGKSNYLTLEYFSFGNIWVRARLIPSERTSDGRISHLLWMLENIDEEKKTRDKLLEVAEKLNHQMSSTAKIYMSMYDFDLSNDTFTEVKATNSQVVDIIGENRENAQDTLNNVMCRMTDESDLGTVLDFIDLKTLDERLKDIDTITLEYMSSDGSWRRARFIASERSRDGMLRHVLWMVEDIDKERHGRRMLPEAPDDAYEAGTQSAQSTVIPQEMRESLNELLGDDLPKLLERCREISEQLSPLLGKEERK